MTWGKKNEFWPVAVILAPLSIWGVSSLISPAGIRYPREVELSMLETGYTIKLNGKKLTKTEIRKRTESK